MHFSYFPNSNRAMLVIGSCILGTQLPAAGADPTVSIANAAVAEGNSGTTVLSLPVTRTDVSTAFTVNYAVTGGTASVGNDFNLANGTLSFESNSNTSQNILIAVNGDTTIENNETIIVTLSNLVNVTGVTSLGTAVGTGTITNDDTVPISFPSNGKITSTLKGFIDLDLAPLASTNGAEIPAFDAISKRAFTSSNSGIQVVDLANPAAPVFITTIVPAALGVAGLTSNDVSSIAVRKGSAGNPSVLAAAIISAPKSAQGYVIFLNPATGALLGSTVVGANPDHLAFSPDGSKLLVANEGELNVLNGLATVIAADTTVGSVSVIQVPAALVGLPTSLVTATADFSNFDSQAADLITAGVRIFQGGKPSTDFEPEYFAISADSTKALVTLQEANAVATLDIASGSFTSVVPLGKKNFANGRHDFSDVDGAAGARLANPTLGNPVFGLYMPDAVGAYAANGQTYYVTANEGDDRNDFLQPDESTTVGNAAYDLDNTVFPNEAALKVNSALGKLAVCNAPGLRGDTDGDGDIDEILSYGGRSFTILDSTGAIVWDSGDMIENIVASQFPGNFDDGRSDNKGPEPEGVAIATLGGRTYAFIGLERSHMVLIFDVTQPTAVTFAGGLNRVGDLNPEGLVIIPANDSPSGKPLLLVASEVSQSLTIHELNQTTDFTLQLLHLADGEAGLLAPTTAPNLAALIDAFDGSYANTLILAGGDNWIPGPFISAGTDVSVRDELNAATGSTMTLAAAANHPIAALDIAMHNVMGVEVSAIGNHEFDLGSRVFRDSFSPALGLTGWVGANFPHISANLDFSADADLNARFTNTLDGGVTNLIPEAATLKGRIAPSVVITKGGKKIGIVGATTQIIESISSPSGTEVKGFPTGAGANGEFDNMPLLASQLQPVIDELTAEGVDKIILMAHLQVIANEQALAPLLTGVDIILAAGSNTRLGDANDQPVAFPGHAANFVNTYPIVTAGADGRPTVIVNTDNEYTYLGRLVADFDADGVLIAPNLVGNSIINGAYAATTGNVASAWNTSEANLATTAFAVGTKGRLVASLTGAVQAVIAAKDGNIAGFTGVYLQGERIAVRNQETNLGNLSADANLTLLRQALGGSASASATVSLKNGGGIRAQIGGISLPDPVTGFVNYLPPAANLAVGKPEGAISQLDIENSLRFNNLLMACDTSPSGLKAIVEHGLALLVNQGRFPQIGGMRFSYDAALAAGSRIRSLALIDENDIITARIIENGVILASAPSTITLVTLSFLAQGGDGYPMKANCDNFRFVLQNTTLGAPLVETQDFGLAANIPSNAQGEQTALFNHLSVRHPVLARAYNVAETAIQFDTRIQQTAFRLDTVLSGPAALAAWLANYGLSDATLDTDNDSLTNLQEFAFGLDPRTPDNVGNITNVVTGTFAARGTPTIYAAPTANGQDFRVVFIRQKSAAASGVNYLPQFSPDLIEWQNSTAIPSVIASDSEVEAVSIRYPFFVNGRKAKFFRMGVSQN